MLTSGARFQVSFVAWTTTPWTLPSNMALCVHPDFEYCKIRDVKTGKVYILLKERLVQLYPIMESKKFKVCLTLATMSCSQHSHFARTCGAAA